MTDDPDFDALYRRESDPFAVSASWYERRKEDVLVASLTRSRYRLAWDCASGTGHLARRLADRCDRVLATDASPEAVTLTVSLTAGQPHIECAVSALPAVPDRGRGADLTIVAEVLYYLPSPARATSIDALAGQAGELVTVHWRHHPHDAHLSGAAVTEELAEVMKAQGWTSVARHDDLDFVLAAWCREDAS